MPDLSLPSRLHLLTLPARLLRCYSDIVLWHTDLVHAVEPQHKGTPDSSVMYIPAGSFNEAQLDVRAAGARYFPDGHPPAYFHDGDGESAFDTPAIDEDTIDEDVMARPAGRPWDCSRPKRAMPRWSSKEH